MKIRNKILLFFGGLIILILILAIIATVGSDRWGVSADAINQQIALETSDFKLELNDFQDSAKIGENITYNINFANNSNKIAKGVKIYGYLGIVNPEETNFISRTLGSFLPTTSQTAPTDRYFNFNLGDLPPKAYGSLRIPIEVKELTANQDEFYSKLILSVEEAQDQGFWNKIWGSPSMINKPVAAALDIDIMQ